MPSIDPTSSLDLGTSPLTPPAGVKLETPEQEQVYRVSLEFERYFVQQMLKPMKDAGSMFGDEETSSTGGYQDMAQDQLTQAVLDGGGLGIAATLYSQMAQVAGIDTTTATGSGPGAKAGGDAA